MALFKKKPSKKELRPYGSKRTLFKGKRTTVEVLRIEPGRDTGMREPGTSELRIPSNSTRSQRLFVLKGPVFHRFQEAGTLRSSKHRTGSTFRSVKPKGERKPHSYAAGVKPATVLVVTRKKKPRGEI